MNANAGRLWQEQHWNEGAGPSTGQVPVWNGTTGQWEYGSGGGGDGSVKTVDLGIVDIPTVLTGGPQTLYAMAPGEFLSTVRFTDTDFVALDVALAFGIAIGTIKSFGWSGFANIAWGLSTEVFTDTLGTAYNANAYDPAQAAGSGTVTYQGSAMVLSSQAAGNVQASVWYAPGDGTLDGSGFRIAAVHAWVANTHYDSLHDNTPATPGVLKSVYIIANGTIWNNSGATGTSGNSSPDFAGNAGGTVTDGPDIVWTDSTLAPPTVGAAHAVAEIWTPA